MHNVLFARQVIRIELQKIGCVRRRTNPLIDRLKNKKVGLPSPVRMTSFFLIDWFPLRIGHVPPVALRPVCAQPVALLRRIGRVPPCALRPVCVQPVALLLRIARVPPVAAPLGRHEM